jgi:hypothetical protein
MDPYLTNIMGMIEAEVERKVGERITSLLEYMSETCDIPLPILTKLMLRVEKKNPSSCMAINKKSNKRCKNSPKDNGYCHLHQSQYVPKVIVPPPKIAHTHTLPPLYMPGCPACEHTAPIKQKKQVDELKLLDAFT